MTWRERIQAARERGKFTKRDRQYWESVADCPAAEMSNATGLGAYGHHPRQGRQSQVWCSQASHPECLWTLGNALGQIMDANDFDAADRLLDAIEDRALQLKREGLTDTPPTPSPADRAEG